MTKVKNKKTIKKKLAKKKIAKKTNNRSKKVFTKEKVQKLFERGKNRGFVTTSEILHFFSNVEKDINGLENLFDELEKEGVEIKETRSFLDETDLKLKEVGKAQKIDPIQLYLKEIGKVSFLTAEQEKELWRSAIKNLQKMVFQKKTKRN